MINFIKQKLCNHLFEPNDMKPRNKNGIVEWNCCKCGKVFREKYGLKILEYGKCTGNWGTK